MTKKQTIQILCTGEITVDYRLLKELQITESGQKLKKTNDEFINKLAYSIQKNGIINNLQVWIDEDGNIFCFDAHHRQMALRKLEDDGWMIPPIPATRCLAKTKKEAQKLLLLKESKNSWIDEDVIQEYINEIMDDIDLSEIEMMVNLDNIDFDFSEPEFISGQFEKSKNPNNVYGGGSYPFRIGPIIGFIKDNETFEKIQSIAKIIEKIEDETEQQKFKNEIGLKIVKLVLDNEDIIFQ